MKPLLNQLMDKNTFKINDIGYCSTKILSFQRQ